MCLSLFYKKNSSLEMIVLDRTIVAMATAIGQSSIHILRLSGPEASNIIQKCFIPNNKKRWLKDENFTLHLGNFHDNQVILDEVLIGKMKAPTSYTGEDVYEINCHGGPFVAQRILQTCLKQGAFLAEPGEFSKRAFLNGKLDLVQAEAIIDLISSRTDAAANMAINQLSGGVSKVIVELREKILEVLAFIEANIDFPEDNVDSLDLETLKTKIETAISDTMFLLKGSQTGKVLRDGLITVIVGRPNVGKSSLMNALLKEERAIVTDIPGTTRDEIRESVNIGGILLQLVDTAGIWESQDFVERLGIERTWKALTTADLILLVVQANIPLNDLEYNIIKSYPDKVIVIMNKVDLLDNDQKREINKNSDWIPFSVRLLEGFDELEKEIRKRVFQGETVHDTDPMLSNVRQIASLQRCSNALNQALESFKQGFPIDIISIDIRQALDFISEITGQNVQESLLDDIFSRFCIGK
jgi:tRNA modification GTPase